MPVAPLFGTPLLTYKEQEIAALVAQGLTNREIAQRLGLSVFTVKNHVRNVLRKLEVKNRSWLARLLGQEEEAASIVTRRGKVWLGGKWVDFEVRTALLDSVDRLPPFVDAHVRPLTVSDETYAIIRAQPVTVKDRDQGTPQPKEQQQGDPQRAPGTNAPQSELVQLNRKERRRKPVSPEQAGKKQGVVYERGRARYKREHLQASAEPLSKLLADTLTNNDDPLSPVAEEALRMFTEAAVKIKGTTLSQASREHNIPLPDLSLWVRRKLIPYLYKDKGATFIAKEIAQEAARDYEDAIKLGVQPARLLKDRREKYFPEASKYPH